MVTKAGAGAGEGVDVDVPGLEDGVGGDEDAEDDDEYPESEAGDDGVDGETAVEGDDDIGAAGGEDTLTGGRGADNTGEKQGFKRSIETVQGLPNLHKVKVLLFLSSTL